MTPPRRPRRNWIGLALGGLLAGPGAIAQTAPAASTAYEDKVIEGLAPDTAGSDTGYAYDGQGWPRFLRLETRLGTQPFDDTHRTRLGLAAYGLIETPNHGTLSFDGTVNPREGRGTLTLRQRGLPLGGGWQAQHELGVINSPAPSITRLPSRVFVPSSVLQGASAEWDQPAQGLQLLAGSGEPGRLDGLPSSRFVGLGGRRDSLGAQWNLGPGGGAERDPLRPLRGWTLALLHESAHQVRDSDSSAGVDADASLLALRHESATTRWQGQAVTSTADDGAGTRSGVWFDGEWDDGPRQHGLGYYRLDPGLSWARLALPSDLEGVTLRSQWRTRQWSAEGSVDWLRTLSGRAAAGRYATGSARWRLPQGASVGIGGSVRHFDGSAWTAYGDGRWTHGMGTAGLRLTLTGGRTEAASVALDHDQDWAMPIGWTLSTSLGLGHRDALASTGEPEQNLWRAAVAWAVPLTGNASLRGSASGEHSDSGARQWGLNLGAQWRIDPRWSLEAHLNRSSGRSVSQTSIDPLSPPVSVVSSSADRSLYAVLRYELQAGRRSVPLGGRAQEGGGSIRGTVYLDANRSGTQEASEPGAAGVTVTLDNRYAVRTDAQGRFEFPFVAAGARTVGVRNDSLPLPWSVVDEGQVTVDVRLREASDLRIPVQRAD